MRIGKLSNQDLERLVLSHMPHIGSDRECGPSVGLDCAVLDMGGGMRLVLSSDPVTASCEDAGRLAIQVSCNDIAASGVRPAGIMLVLVVPPDSGEDLISGLMDQAAGAAADLGVRIAGGHTEVSGSVNRAMLVTTAFGWTSGEIVQASGARIGDTLLMTKTAGIEGTAILARDHADWLAVRLDGDTIGAAQAMIRRTGVVEEGLAAAAFGVHAMHDATEGGILGAVWELCSASGAGCRVRIRDIPVHPATTGVAGVFGIDPLRLISSGSMILASDHPEGLIAALAAKGIECTPIGTVERGTCLMERPDGTVSELDPPEADELYKTAGNSYY